MNELKIRLLRADEIECRIGTISDKGISLLLYKDARADMKILDETFGILGWRRTHSSLWTSTSVSHTSADTARHLTRTTAISMIFQASSA